MSSARDEPSPELSHAGAVVDQAIDFMVRQQLGSLPIASALLAGALALMARTMERAAIVRVLKNAIDSVQDDEARPTGLPM